MKSGSEQLQAWLDRSHLNQRSGAKYLGMHFTTLNKLLANLRQPGRELAISIEAKTGIPVAAWATSVVKRQKRTPPNGRKGQCWQGANA